MKDLFQNKTFKFALIGFLVFVIIVLFLPIVFVKYSMFGLDYRATGQIGDTIGGITAPFIAIGAAFLTFIAFWVQYQANQKQWALIINERLISNFISEFEYQTKLILDITSTFSIKDLTSLNDVEVLKYQMENIFNFFYYSYHNNKCIKEFPLSLHKSGLIHFISSNYKLQQKITEHLENIDVNDLTSEQHKILHQLITTLTDIIKKSNSLAFIVAKKE